MTEPSVFDQDARFEPERFFNIARQVGHGRALGMEFGASGDDWTELVLPWREELVGVPDSGILASGAIVSLIDTASGTAVWANLGKFIPLVTIDLRIDYLRPAFRGENVRARCQCKKLTRRIAFTRGTAFVGAKPIAYSSGTFMIGV